MKILVGTIFWLLSSPLTIWLRIQAESLSSLDGRSLWLEDFILTPLHLSRESLSCLCDSLRNIHVTESWTVKRTKRDIEGFWEIFSFLVAKETFKRTNETFCLLGFRGEEVVPCAVQLGRWWWELRQDRKSTHPWWNCEEPFSCPLGPS